MKTERKTIDITPTWLSLVPVMLEIYRDHHYHISEGVGDWDKSEKVMKTIEDQFKRMATAADAFISLKSTNN